MIKPSITLKSLAQSIISTAGLVTVLADRGTAICDNSLGMLDDLSANGKDYTAMSKLDDMTQRRVDYKAKYADSEMPAALKLIMDTVPA